MKDTPYSRNQPLPAQLSVREARDAYLAENGFSIEAYDAPWTPVNFLGLRLAVPNPPKHRTAIMWHDLHHVATGYGTDPVGEAEVSAWELRNGVWGIGPYTMAIVTTLAAMGWFIASGRTRMARHAASGQSNLFGSDRNYEDLLALRVGDLRELLGVPTHGLATHPRKLHAGAPS